MDERRCDGRRDDGSVCGAELPPTYRTVKCADCRREHRKRKQADYQHAARVRLWEANEAERRVKGWPLTPIPKPPARTVTPSWTQDGRPAESSVKRLAVLDRRLKEAEQAIKAVRELLASELARHIPDRY